MRPLIYENGILRLIDQRKLPIKHKIVKCRTYKAVAKSIKEMVIRGAPVIAVTAAYGIAIGASKLKTTNKEKFFEKLNTICNTFRGTRPTAINLFVAINRIYDLSLKNKDKSIDDIKSLILNEAFLMDKEDVEINKLIGQYGKTIIQQNWKILTYSNAGALASTDYGTALGIVRASYASGKNITVYASETRPYMEGARLTTWELKEDGIPVVLICDNMTGHFMKTGNINCVIVGAERIAANGDTLNNIGTYSVAVLAKVHGIPFYVAAPYSSIDLKTQKGNEFPIEEQNLNEVTHVMGKQIAPKGVVAKNPAFDLTPADLITGIITEKGILYPDLEVNALVQKSE